MAKRNLYLCKVIDIVGQSQYDYMEHLWKDPVQEMPGMDMLQGSFYICAFGGGRRPQPRPRRLGGGEPRRLGPQAELTPSRAGCLTLSPAALPACHPERHIAVTATGSPICTRPRAATSA